MKKLVSLFICVCLIFTMLTAGIVTASAEGNPIDGTSIVWNFNSETGALHFEGEGAIPDYNTYKDELGNISLQYPWNNVAFTSVVFGEGITGIGNYAFAYNKTLKSVEIPDTVTVLGDGVFFWCESLETVKLPSEVTEVSDKLFACSGIKNVTFGAKTEKISSQAFLKCVALEAVTFPSTLKTIEADAFSNCSALKKVEVPEGVTSIGEQAFYSCSALEEITLPSTLEQIGEAAFDSCEALKAISLPEKITSVPAYICSGCSVLASVTLPETVETIGEKAFDLCLGLKEITLPSSLKAIGEKAFGYGKRGAKIDGFTIKGYSNSIAKAHADENGFAFISIGYFTTGTCGEGITWEYKDEDKTLYITGTGAMADYTATAAPAYAVVPYEKVSIGEGITRIGAYAFYGAKAMDFAISENVTEIGEKAIGYAVGDGNTEILTEGTSITAYGDTKAHEYATANNVAFNELTRPTPTSGECGEGVTWEYKDEDKTLYITGAGAMVDYSLDSPAVYNAHPYEKISLDEKLTKIGAYAFYGAKAMDFAISENVTEIGEKAIGYSVGEDGAEILTEGTSITAYDSTKAHEYATANNIKFNSLGEIPYLAGTCGENATWYYDKATKALTVSGTGAISDYKIDALPEFAALEISAITVSDGITAIGNYALCTAKPYNTITLGKDIVTIGENAFGFTTEKALDENGQPTDELTVTANAELAVNGYIITPADEYSSACGFKFNALDTETYPIISFLLTSVVDHRNKLIFIYTNTPKEAPTAEGFPTDKYDSVDAPEAITTGSTIKLTDKNGTYEYKFIVMADSNADGKVNSTDALTMLSHSVKKAEIEDPDKLTASDINLDGKVNSTDALVALQISVGSFNAEDFYTPGRLG